MAFKASFRKDFSISEVVTRLVVTILALYVGGTILTQIGSVINGTTSPLYGGLTLIGWTVTNGTVTNTTSNSGILAVVGIIGIASIVMQFVKFKFR
jgi:hypothetical protein